MYLSKRAWSVGGLLCLAALGSIGGCPMVDTAALEASAEQMQFVGRSGNTLILGKTDFPRSAFSLASLGSDTPPRGVLHSVGVDLDTLEVTPLPDRSTDDESAYEDFGLGYGYGTLSNAAWSVRTDYAVGGIVVREIASGAETRYLDGYADTGVFELGALDGDRLAVTALHRRGGDGLLLVIDLKSGEQTIVGPIINGYGTRAVALSGDEVAYWRPPGYDGGSLEGFFTPPALELVNLATGERTRAATASTSDAELRVDFAGGRVVWSEWTYQVLNVNGYNAADQSNQALASIATVDGDNSYTELRDYNGVAVLLSRVDTSNVPTSLADALQVRQRVVVTLHFYDGREVTLIDREENVLGLGPLSVGVLTDRYAVVSDPRTDELIVYDLNTGETKRIRPFAT